MLKDLPIESCKEENEYKMDRCNFSKFLGDVLLNYNDDESIVIGLSGEWGSGKSSIRNMALEHINKKMEKKPEEEPPVIIKFNPWNYSDQNQLLIQFFNEFIIKLESLNFGKKIINNIASYAKRLTVNTGVLIGGFFRPNTTQIYLNYFKSDEKSENETLIDLRESLDKSLINQKRKIIIIIEDIDRLNNIETRQVFQLVKLLANFPKTIYLLEFDKKIVSKSLEADIHEDYSSEYLEKIVQVIYDVPKLTELEIELILNYEISKLIGNYSKKLNKNTWDSYYQNGLKSLFKNIRSIKRYINTLKLSFEILKDEVRLEDLFIITAVQIFVPDLYNFIKNNKSLFVSTQEDILSNLNELYENKEYYKEKYDTIIKKCATEHASEEELKQILQSLFPIVDHVYNNSKVSIYNELLSLCVPNAFDTYFRLSVPQWEISHKEFNNLISKSNNSKEFGDILLKFSKEGKLKKILDYLDIYFNTYPSEIPSENIEPIITALMDKGDLFPLNNPNLVDISIINHIWKLIEILLRYIKENERCYIIKRAVQNTNESLNTICLAVYSIEKIQPQNNFISEKTLQELKKIVCEKIEEHASSGKLIQNYDPFQVIYNWNEWCDKSKVNNYLIDIMSKNEEFIVLLFKIIAKNYTKNSIEIVFNLKELRNNILLLKKSNEFNGLEEPYQNIINNFLNKIT